MLQQIIGDISAVLFSILLMSCIGVFLKLQGYLTKENAKYLSKILEYIFQPCMIFSVFVLQLKINQIEQWLPNVITTISSIFVGFIVGYLSNKFITKDEQFKGIMILATGLGHVTNIQLNLSYGLQDYLGQLEYKGISGENVEQWDQQRKQEEALGRAYTYIIINILIHTVMRWTIGKQIIMNTNKQFIEEKQKRESQLLIEQQKQKEIELKNMANTASDNLSDSLLIQSQNQLQNQKSFVQLYNLIYEKYFWYMNPPLWSCVVAIIISSIQPFRLALLTQGTFYNRAIFNTTQILGKVYPPLNMLVMGASVYESFKAENKKLKNFTLIGIIGVRHILYPIINWIWILILEQFGIINDQVLSFITLTSTATGIAQNLLLIAINYSDFQNEVSKILGIGYTLNIITLPIILTAFFKYYLPNSE